MKENLRIPAKKLAEIAKVLEVSTDELLGLAKKKSRGAKKGGYLRRKLQVVENFNKKDQKTITSVIESLEKSYRADKSD